MIDEYTPCSSDLNKGLAIRKLREFRWDIDLIDKKALTVGKSNTAACGPGPGQREIACGLTFYRSRGP
jgi:hypothetical protein